MNDSELLEASEKRRVHLLRVYQAAREVIISGLLGQNFTRIKAEQLADGKIDEEFERLTGKRRELANSTEGPDSGV